MFFSEPVLLVCLKKYGTTWVFARIPHVTGHPVVGEVKSVRVNGVPTGPAGISGAFAQSRVGGAATTLAGCTNTPPTTVATTPHESNLVKAIAASSSWLSNDQNPNT